MKLFPAIDILNNRAVRLLYGEYDKVTDYGSPIEFAEKWKNCGADFLHIVDLSGALSGESNINKNISEIKNKVKISIQSGGGLRSLDDIKARIDAGADRVILGTVCYTDPKTFERAVDLFGDKIVAGIDAKKGYLSIKGWTEVTEKKAVDFGNYAKKLGVNYAVYTDIAKDGAMTGVNLEETVNMTEKTGLSVIASGGISSVNDLVTLKKYNIYGAILGRSIYNGAIDLKDAFEVINAL